MLYEYCRNGKTCHGYILSNLGTNRANRVLFGLGELQIHDALKLDARPGVEAKVLIACIE